MGIEERFDGLDARFEARVGDVGVDFGGAGAGVAAEAADGEDVDGIEDEERCEGMPRGVEGDVFVDGGV